MVSGMAGNLLFEMSMNTLKYIKYLIIMLIGFSCDKVDVPDPVDVGPIEPVFYTDLDLGNMKINAAAGKDNYVMDASYQIDPGRGTLDLIGFFRPEDCTGRPCNNSLKIILRNHLVYSNATFNVNNFLKKDRYEFAWTVERDSAVVKFKARQSPTASAALIWRIGDREIRNREQIEYVVKVDRDYPVSIRTNQQACASRQQQTINLLTGGCSSVIKIENRRAVVRTTGKPPFKYQWSTGARDSLVILDPVLTNTMKEISVKVIDSENCESEYTLGFSPGTANDRYCETSFTYTRHPRPSTDLLQLGRAMIEYTDDQGTTLRSGGYRQPRDASFEIVEVSDFEENEMGQKTKKIQARITCLLGNPDNPEEEVKLSGTCVFAIAYPD